jgi:hypothetical protein
VYRYLPTASYYVLLDFLHLENRDTNPNLTPLLVNLVGSNPMNNEAWRWSVSMLPQRVSSDCETSNELKYGDITDCVVLCAVLPNGGKQICQAPPAVEKPRAGWSGELGRTFPESTLISRVTSSVSMQRFASCRLTILPPVAVAD